MHSGFTDEDDLPVMVTALDLLGGITLLLILGFVITAAVVVFQP